jgi:hypothetical protein
MRFCGRGKQNGIGGGKEDVAVVEEEGMEEERLEQYLSWLDSEIRIYETYHESKETRAWTAVAAYAPTVITVGYTASSNLKQQQFYGYPLDLILCGSLVLFLICVFAFTKFQFQSRWEADCITRALRRVRGLLIANPSYLDCSDDRLLWIGEKCHWPRFIENEIGTFKGQWLTQRAWCTEIPSYVVLLLATFLAMCLVCINSDKSLSR